MGPITSSSDQIKLARPDDVIQIGQMLRRFYQEHGEVYAIKYDHASCLSTVLKTIVDGVCLLGRASCAGALLLPFPFNREALVAQVVFWYIENRREIAIFDMLLKECQKRGATHVNVATVAPRHVGKRFYAVRGLKLAEAQYLGPIVFPCNGESKS